MLNRCPVCGLTCTSAPCWWRAQAPIHQLLPVGQAAVAADFGQLDIVACEACGHLWNRAYDPACAERMYTSGHLTNVPVTVGMGQHLQNILDWIGEDAHRDRRVLEVGAGSGAFARLLARSAHSVTVVEPSRGLLPSAFPETNVTLVSDMFPPARALAPADLVICRQVMEHVADPAAMFADLAAALAPGGRLYVEVPNAAYVRSEAAIFDFHYAHVQYFAAAGLCRLAAAAGLQPERIHYLNAERDLGVLFRRGAGTEPAIAASAQGAGDLAVRGRQRQLAYEAWFARGASLALYGATWNGLAFLNAFDQPPPFRAVLDDNPHYAGCALYHPRLQVPVEAPEGFAFRTVDAIVITAYHHAPVIAQRLRHLAFKGTILSAAETPEPEAP